MSFIALSLEAFKSVLHLLSGLLPVKVTRTRISTYRPASSRTGCRGKVRQLSRLWNEDNNQAGWRTLKKGSSCYWLNVAQIPIEPIGGMVPTFGVDPGKFPSPIREIYGGHVWVGGGGDGCEEALMKKTGKAAVTVGEHASAAAEALLAAPGRFWKTRGKYKAYVTMTCTGKSLASTLASARCSC
jgi:hypothetical protein